MLVLPERERTKKGAIGVETKGVTCKIPLDLLNDFNGTQLAAFINNELPVFPCIILSNYCESGKEENLVIKIYL